MNKKFSTLLASALLVASTGAFAGINHSGMGNATDEIRNGKYYVLGVGQSSVQEYVGVAQTTDGTLQFKAIANASLSTLARVDSVLWSVSTEATGNGGFVRFVLTNKATGVTLSFDEDNAVVGNGAAVTPKSTQIGGTMTQWKWYDSRFGTQLGSAPALTVDFANGDSTMTVKIDNTTKVLYVAKEHKSKTLSGQALRICTPGTWTMSAEDLNTKGDDVKYMQLSFKGNANTNNIFAEKWQAQNLSGTPADTVAATTNFPFAMYSPYNASSSGWSPATSTAADKTVILNKIDADGELTGDYLHVDTSYYASRGNTYKLYNQLATSQAIMKSGSTYQIDTLGRNLPNDAFRFMFTKNLLTDSVQVKAISGFVEMASYATPKNQKGSEVTKYTLIGPAIPSGFGLTAFNGAVITLSSGVVPTPAQDVRNNNLNFNILSHCTLEGETTKVITFWSDDSTRPADNHVNLWAYAGGIDVDYTSVPDGVYTIKDAETGEYLGVHIYTTDSVAKYTGYEAIDNMNFDHMPAFQWVVLKKDHFSDAREAVSPVSITNREFDSKNNFSPIQLRKGSKDGQYKWQGREVIFTEVGAAQIADKYLGYKKLKDEDLKVNRYKFNYWHPYTQSKYLAVNEKDSILNVLTDAAERFTITGTTEASYGYTPSTDAKTYIPDLVRLVRREYTVISQGVKPIYANKEGQFMVTDDAAATDVKASFYFKENNEFKKNDKAVCYYALIAKNLNTKSGVRQNDMKALLLSEVLTEISTATFDIQKDDAPLYRRFNNVALGENDVNGDSIRFFESIRKEYLMDENNREGGLMDANVNYVGMWTADKATGLAFRIDTIVINRANGDVKPQYLISVNIKDYAGQDSAPCTLSHEHLNGVTEWTCPHATKYIPGFDRRKYMVSFADSAAIINGKPYKDIVNGYVRVGFVEAIRQADTLWVLPNEFKALKNEQINFAELQAYNDSVKAIDPKLAIKNQLNGVNHKNYTWSFRYVDPEAAGQATQEGAANSFLIESNKYGATEPDVAPSHAAWLKIQNQTVVLTNSSSTFANAKTGGDGALVFNVDNIANDELATDNETIATSEVTVIAGNGNVQIIGAAGKKVVITNILGQTVANTVLSSDNTTIAAPAGVVVVAIEGEEAVKAIVK